MTRVARATRGCVRRASASPPGLRSARGHSLSGPATRCSRVEFSLTFHTSVSLTPEVAFERYRDRLLSVIYVRMGPALRRRMDPEDVLQEVAIQALHSWHTLADERNVGAWLVTLARRKIARIIRDQVGVAARDPRRERAIQTDVPVADRRTGPVTAADRKDRLALLADALERLSPTHREVVILSRIEKLPAKEIAKRLGRTENAVHLLLGRALKRLAEELKLSRAG